MRHRLEELFDLAVGVRGVGPGAQMPHACTCTSVAEVVAAIGATVVGHDPLDGDAVAGKPGERPIEEGDRAGLALVGQDLGVGQARGVIDGAVQAFLAEAATMRWIDDCGQSPRHSPREDRQQRSMATRSGEV